MKFFLEIEPPTVTHQERKIKVIGGRPVFYDTPELKEARALLYYSLCPFKPKEPFKGALELRVRWLFRCGKHTEGWRVTKPDTDNLEKMLKDTMTRLGFWTDDALVVRESTEKRWSKSPVGIEIEIVELENE